MNIMNGNGMGNLGSLSGLLSNTPSEIIPGLLYLGSMWDAENLSKLKQIGIKRIVNCALEAPNAHPNDFSYIKFSLDDAPSQQITPVFQEAFKQFDDAKEKGEKVLCHCMAGVSRSATIVIAYIMTRRDMSLKDSIDYVRRRRPAICPNPGFMHQLCELEKTTRNTTTSTVALNPRIYDTGNAANKWLDDVDDDADI